VAAALKQDTGVQVKTHEGERGEFTVLVNGQEVARKGASMPSTEEVLAAVRKAPGG
jgi:hypothetical protein